MINISLESQQLQEQIICVKRKMANKPITRNRLIQNSNDLTKNERFNLNKETSPSIFCIF